jgi:ketosteroid isomerase-like protein
MSINTNLIEVALALLQDEANGNVGNAKEKMNLDEYSMTWMYRSRDTLFPSEKGQMLEKEMEDVYEIQNRQYEIMHTAQNDNVVFIEMIESYPDTETGKEYRTPITLVLEFKESKVVRGRHYTDPNLSHEYLSQEVIHSAIGSLPKMVIKTQSS